MKKALSISLGSTTRNHKSTMRLGEHRIELERLGVDGDVKEAIRLYGEYDGKVDAFGAGGFLFGFHVGDRYYKLRSVNKIVKNVKTTPVVDGNGIKNTIERSVLQSLPQDFNEIRKELNNRALITSAVDRYGMAQSIEDAGYEMVMGDLMFALGIPIKVKSMKGLRRLTRLLMPIMSWFPISWLYPVGEKQLEHSSKFENHFEKPSLIAGDYLFIKQFAPHNLENKVIVTNTTTAEDRDDLADRGARALITTTPRIDGRSYGTNMLEAGLVAMEGKNRPLTHEEMLLLVKKHNLKPDLEIF